MSKRMSYSKVEKAILHDFRNKINHAESTEDIKKFFVYITQRLFDEVFAGEITCDFDDVSLRPTSEPAYQLHERLLSSGNFKDVWNNSDLPQVMDRLATVASNHYTRLKKNPGKTESKIRM